MPDNEKCNIETLFRDPLGELTRKKRSILSILSVAVLLMKCGNFIPERISFFGLEFPHVETRDVFIILFVFIIYFLFSFIIHAIPDYHSIKIKIAALPSTKQSIAGLSNKELKDVLTNALWDHYKSLRFSMKAKITLDFVLPPLMAILALVLIIFKN